MAATRDGIAVRWVQLAKAHASAVDDVLGPASMCWRPLSLAFRLFQLASEALLSAGGPGQGEAPRCEIVKQHSNGKGRSAGLSPHLGPTNVDPSVSDGPMLSASQHSQLLWQAAAFESFIRRELPITNLVKERLARSANLASTRDARRSTVDFPLPPPSHRDLLIRIISWSGFC